MRYPLKSVSSVVTRIPRWLKSACVPVMSVTPTACVTSARSGAIAARSTPNSGPSELMMNR